VCQEKLSITPAHRLRYFQEFVRYFLLVQMLAP